MISYYEKDIEKGTLTKQNALEMIECLWLKFNEIVYMRNSHGAKYFAGFPIGFNIAIGGQDENGNDYSNDLSFLFLEAKSIWDFRSRIYLSDFMKEPEKNC